MKAVNKNQLCKTSCLTPLVTSLSRGLKAQILIGTGVQHNFKYCQI
jgi:hypothetical protein